MAEIVNLRMARKAKARAAAGAEADIARARHGRSKAEKAETNAEVSRIGKSLDGAKREKDLD